MYSILAAVIFSVIIVINFLIILGLPFGELTMGGQYKILPKNMRFVAVYCIHQKLYFLMNQRLG